VRDIYIYIYIYIYIFIIYILYKLNTRFNKLLHNPKRLSTLASLSVEKQTGIVLLTINSHNDLLFIDEISHVLVATN